MKDKIWICGSCGKPSNREIVEKQVQQDLIKYIKKEFPITKHFDRDYFEFYNKQIKNRIKEMEKVFELD